MNIPNNVFLSYYENGKIKSLSERTSPGFFQGISVYWHENGHMDEICDYVNGEPEGLYRAWYSNKQLMSEVNFVNGIRHGRARHWYRSGNQEKEFYFIDGEKHGIQKQWYDGKKITISGVYVNGINVTNTIKSMVRNIDNITEQEKTSIALHVGLVL